MTFSADLYSEVSDYLDKGYKRSVAQWFLYGKAMLIVVMYAWSYYLFVFESTTFGALLIHALFLGICHVLIPVNIVHDAIHKAFSRNIFVNELALWSLILVGADPFMYRKKHLESHASYSEGSPHSAIETQELLMKKDKESSVHYVFYLFYAFYMIYVRDFVLYLKDRAECGLGRWAALLTSKAVYGFVILVAPFLLVDLAWWQISLGIYTIYLTITILLVIILLMPTDPMENFRGIDSEQPNESWVTEIMRHYVDFSPQSHLLNQISGGSNMNVVHHLFPEINHMHYVEISKILSKASIAHNVSYSTQNVSRVIGIHINYIRKIHRDSEGETSASKVRQ